MNTYRSESSAEQVARASVLRRLELDVWRRLDGGFSGDYRTASFGPGSERAGAREYQPGDDARAIDWNLTARANSVHVRITEADRELQTWIVADRSASMDLGTVNREKRDVVLGIAAALGVLTVRGGNRFGVLACGGSELTSLPSAAGHTSMLAALAFLDNTRRQTAPPGPKADLSAALVALRRLQPRRGQVVVVSDFLDRSDWSRGLRELALRHQVIGVHVTDPREIELPDVGMLSVVDPESGHSIHVQTRSARLRERYARAARERMERITGAVRGAGAEYLALSTDRDWLTDFIGFVTRRHGSRWFPAGGAR